MKIQFDNNELITVTRSPYHSDTRLVMYIAPGQVPVENLIAQARASEHIYFYVNDTVLASYSGYTQFNSASINDTEIALTMINPNPERQPSADDYIEAVKILLGDEVVENATTTEVQ